MKYICPLLVVSDIESSRAFYENVLNQKVKFDFGENVTFEGDFAIHLDEHYLGLINIETEHHIKTHSNNFELYFESQNIEHDFEKLKAENIQFIHQLIARPWGQRVMCIYDPDMHIIEIGESMDAVILRLNEEGFSIEEITEKSSMPLAYVKHVLGID